MLFCEHQKQNYKERATLYIFAVFLCMLPPFCLFPLCHDNPTLTMQGQENSPAQAGGGADEGGMTSTQE